MSAKPPTPPYFVELSGFEMVTHYTLPIFLLLPAAATIYALLTHHFAPDRVNGMRVVCMLTLPLAAVVALYLRHALRFRSLATCSESGTNYKRVIGAIREAGWHIRSNDVDSRIIASVPGAVTWGTRVEVRFHGTEVLVNSICDPGKYPCAVGWFENGDNLKVISTAVGGI